MSETDLGRYRPYPDYKDSGVEWLGEIPAHWDAASLKRLAFFSYGDSLASESRDPTGAIPVFGSNGQVGLHSDANTHAPCLIVGRKGSFGKINYSSEPCFAIDTTYYVDDRTAKADIRWLFYSMSSLGLDESSQDSAIPGLSREYAHSQQLPLPPLPEQKAITAFLDRETTRIDELIAHKQRLIELLQEKRSALITQAVTQGLDPDVEMKDSGVEWLGRVPAGWEVSRLKGFFEEVDSRSPTGSELLLSLRMHLGLVPHNDVSDKEIPSSALIGFKLTTPGELVMNRMRATLGLFAITPQIGLVSPDYAVFQPSNEIVPEFFLYMFRTSLLGSVFRTYSKGMGTGSSGFLRLYSDRFGLIKVPIPPFSEQIEICAWLDESVEEMDNLETKIQLAINHLNEYRTALISAAVTGKIDVRPLPNPPLAGEGDDRRSWVG